MPDRFPDVSAARKICPTRRPSEENYVDPLAKDPEGKEYDKHWLAKPQSVSIRDGNTGWIVIVQESYEGAIGRTLERLKSSLSARGLVAVALIAGLSAVLWAFVIRVVARAGPRRAANGAGRRGSQRVSHCIGDSSPHTGSRLVADLIAQGADSQHRWRRTLLVGRPVTLGRAPNGWPTSWDDRVSRQHAEIRWDGQRLEVRQLPGARNPIFVKGRPAAEFEIVAGRALRHRRNHVHADRRTGATSRSTCRCRCSSRRSARSICKRCSFATPARTSTCWAGCPR